MRKAVFLSGAAAAACLLFSGICCAGDGGSDAGASFLSAESEYLPGEDTEDGSGAGESANDDSGDGAGTEKETEYVPEVEEVHVTVPGMEGESTLLWVSDLHLCSGPEDPGVTEEHTDDVQERYDMFRSASGKTSCETWELLSSEIDSYGADYVIFGADMLDYVSEENLSILQQGLDNVETPWMYIRADHDYGRWYGDMKIKKMRKLHRRIAPQNKMWVERFEDFTLVGLDNTTTAVSEETLEEFRQVYEEGIPIILCTHVPFDSGSKDAGELARISKEGWGDRVLCWGDGDDYDTSSGGTMAELLDMITAKDSPVCAVFAGHLHLTWDGSLTDTCVGHVFSAAYEDHIGIITVSG